eukprot:11210192-Lingulodinium_polyedra.AAC.1
MEVGSRWEKFDEAYELGPCGVRWPGRITIPQFGRRPDHVRRARAALGFQRPGAPVGRLGLVGKDAAEAPHRHTYAR